MYYKSVTTRGGRKILKIKKASKLLTFFDLYGVPGAIRTPDRLVRRYYPECL